MNKHDYGSRKLGIEHPSALLSPMGAHVVLRLGLNTATALTTIHAHCERSMTFIAYHIGFINILFLSKGTKPSSERVPPGK